MARIGLFADAGELDCRWSDHLRGDRAVRRRFGRQLIAGAIVSAGKSCTTLYDKSATRAHIESLGYDIVGNFGDQFSDLEGGFADRTFKLPDPNDFLP